MYLVIVWFEQDFFEVMQFPRYTKLPRFYFADSICPLVVYCHTESTVRYLKAFTLQVMGYI